MRPTRLSSSNRHPPLHHQQHADLCQCHKMSRASMRSSARSHSSLRRRGTCYREFGYTLADFAGNTSAHGIPRAYNSRGRLRRFLWLLLFLCCFVAFSGQAYQIVKRFFRNDIIVGVELKFENIPFPSVTVCNLNPYKNSLAREMVSVGDTLLAYDSAMAAFHSHSHQQHQQPSRLHKREANGTTANNNNGGRRRWLSRFEGLLAVFAFCQCQPDSLMGCQALKDVDQAANGAARAPLCLCFYNPQNEQVWPCFEPAQWLESQCRGCSSLGNCAFEQSTGWNGGRNGNNNSSSNGKAQQNKTAAGIGHGQQPSWPCLCAPAIRICVRVDDQPGKGNRNGNGNRTSNSSSSTSADAPPLMERVPKIWELKRVEMLLGDETEEQREAKQEAYGLRGVNDPIAIRAKAVENLVFAVNSLTELEKRRMGYGKQEFITKCSFNGRQCSVEDDFSLYVDPTFGNCFTFNAHSESNVRSERAGPNYGLRFQVFVNVSDYLPTTEAAGVRITVHSPEDQPFPDTHGHSAPTGFVSSFGIRLKRVNRLPAPYGDCVEHGKTAEYIFRDKDYSTEGCQRSCIQRLFVRRCGCGDPRFPRYMNYTNCPVGDPKLRACLRRELKSAARSATQPDCVCRQPCREQVYSITYSCARWPSSDLALQGSGDCDPELSGGQCLQFHREQSAIVEVYFEQLNYESLQESEAYGLPNLLSDFGGQLGLWMGVSVITIMEVGLLFSELLIRFALFPCANALRQVFESGSEEELAAATVAPGGGRVVAEQQMRKSRRVLAHKGSFIQWIDADELEEEEKPSRYGPHINEVEKCEKEEESNDGAAKYYSIEDDQ